MRALSSDEILGAFAPHDRKNVMQPAEPSWDELDFLGWTHRSGHLGYLLWHDIGGPSALILERSVIRTSGARLFMCDLCCTLHEQGGIASFTRRHRGRSRSHMLCADLQCSLYVRGRRHTDCMQMPETLGVPEKVGRLRAKLDRLVVAFSTCA
jgi:hypothetical protein